MAHWLKRLIDRNFGKFSLENPEGINPTPPEVDENRWPNWPKGSLPHSLRLTNVPLYRYHPTKYVELGETWYRMVWDLDYKWTAQGRYAGASISPGHFFAVHPEGAMSEMKAYDAKVEEYELLRFEISIDNILDLTDINAVTWFYKKHFLDDGKDWHWAVIMDALFSQQLGGDHFNAYAGQKALQDGYNGIAFFSVRAIDGWWEEPGNMDYRRDYDLMGLYHSAMREDRNCINLVIYFGHNVVRATHNISLSDNRLIINTLFGTSNFMLDKIFSGDSAKPADTDLTFDSLQARVGNRTFWPTRPGIVEWFPGQPKGDK